MKQYRWPRYFFHQQYQQKTEIMLPRRERQENGFSAPLAGFDSNKCETGPTRTDCLNSKLYIISRKW
ncbi:hypothetical protein MKW92_025631 [Papaver armeniacum]|nr:hypothetical protein MKW92_025631 [Papaver armeniacum]